MVGQFLQVTGGKGTAVGVEISKMEFLPLACSVALATVSYPREAQFLGA